MWNKRVLRLLAGLLGGYLLYLPVLFIVEHAIYGRIDTERAFYALYYPFEAPYLVVRSSWKNAPPDEIVLQIAGGVLLVTGALLSLRGVKRGERRSL